MNSKKQDLISIFPFFLTNFQKKKLSIKNHEFKAKLMSNIPPLKTAVISKVPDLGFHMAVDLLLTNLA